MKIYVVAAFAFVMTWLLFLQTAESQELVRVRLKAAQEDIVVSGMAIRVNGVQSSFAKVAIPQIETLRIRRFEKAEHSFWLVTRRHNSRSQIISEEFLTIQAQDLRSETQSLPSQILLSPSGRKKMDLVAVVPLDEYITGVIASEMPLNWPLETLKAQAVAARSYALAVMKERRNKVYHLESSILDQVFKHIVLKDDDTLLKKAARAVSETKNIRMLGEKGHVLKAFYHSDCGGKTTSAKNVWNTTFSAGETVDESCPVNPRAHWQTTIAKENLYAKLKKFFALEKSAVVQSLDFIPMPGEERIRDVQLHLNDGKLLTINGNDFRGIVGFQDLKSNLFKVREDEKNLSFVGRGFGHGVGLCQWGSRMLGLQGRKYQEILKHYYPFAQLVTKN